MKLKLVVASMSVLGLISCPVLAADQVKHKHKHHHAHRAHVVTQPTAQYKDMGALPVEVCPKVDAFTPVLDAMSHNIGRAKSTVHCMDPISFAGGANFDAAWGNRRIGYSGENIARLSLNDVYVNVYGNINDWASAFASINYDEFKPSNTNTINVMNGVYSNSYTANQLQLEQGFVTFKNANVSPFFARVGKMFNDFGRYNIHPMSESFTQVMSEALHTTAQVGFATPVGFNGSLYTFENNMYKTNSSHAKSNYGLSLNFDQPNDQLGWGVGLGWLYDFTGVDQVKYGVSQFNTTGNASGNNGTYNTRVSGGTLYGHLNSGPFTLAVNYATALQAFSNVDLATRTKTVIANGAVSSGAKPWSADITGGYGFNGWGKDQNIYLGYQKSKDAVNLFLPSSRWQVGYGINMWKAVMLGLQVNHDMAYSSSYGGTGGSSNAVVFRASTMFG